MRRLMGCGAVGAVVLAVCAMGQAGGPGGSTGAAATTRAGKVPFTISKETTAITGPLRADGTVDYVAALNEKYGKGVLPENNGFVVWLKVVGTGEDVIPAKIRPRVLKMAGAAESGAEAWERYGDYLKRTKGMAGDDLKKATSFLSEAGSQVWVAAEHPDLAAFLKLRGKQLDLLPQAVAKAKWWSPTVPEDADVLLSADLSGSAAMREVMRSLSARATLRGKSGDFNGFLADEMTLRKWARHLAGGPSLIDRMLGSAAESAGQGAVGVVAGGGLLSEPQCTLVASSAGGLAVMPSVVESVDGMERWKMLDVVTGVAVGRAALLTVGDEAGDPALAGKPNWLATIDRGEVDWDAMLRLTNDFFDKEVRAMRIASFKEMSAATKQMDEQVKAWQVTRGVDRDAAQDMRKKAGETRAAYTQRVGETLLAVLLPEYARAEEFRRREELGNKMVGVVLAAGRVKARTGKWPQTLGELVPGSMKEVPKDIYSKDGAEAVKYVVKADGIEVYSVGPDGKDDGGVNDRAKDKDDIGMGVVAN